MIASYARVSSDRQEQENTIGTQLLQIKDLAAKKGDTINVFFQDEAWPGGVLERPQLNQLREQVRNGTITKIYVYDPDRLARGFSLQAFLIGELESNGAELVFCTQPNTGDLPEVAQVSIKAVNAMVSEIEKIKIRERTKGGRLRKVREGHICTSRPPYGLKYVIGNKAVGLHGYFEHNPEEIETTKLILGWAKEGKSDLQIIRLLKDKGIPTRKGNKFWAKSTIHKILSTNLSVYAGVWNYNKYKMTIPRKTANKSIFKKTFKSSRVLNNKDVLISVTLDPKLAIITQTEVDLIRRRKTENRAIKKTTQVHQHLLQGRIYCAKCGGMNYADCSHDIRVYRCANRKRMYPSPATCSGGQIKAEILEKAVWDQLLNFILDKKRIKQEAEKFINRNKTDTIMTDQGLVEVMRNKIDLQKETERLTTGYVKGLIGEDELSRQKARIQNELEILNSKQLEITESKSQNIDLSTLTKDIDTLRDKIKVFLSARSFDDKRKIMEWLAVKVMYHEGNFEINGILPIVAGNCTQHPINVGSVQQPRFKIPFTLVGQLQRSKLFPFAFA